MIRTTKLRGFAFGLGHHRRRMMAANVEESPQNTVISAHDHDRFASDVGRDVLARLRHLIRARGELPRVGKHGFEFEIVEIFVVLPRGGIVRRLIEREIRIVLVDDSRMILIRQALQSYVSD